MSLKCNSSQTDQIKSLMNLLDVDKILHSYLPECKGFEESVGEVREILILYTAMAAAEVFDG